MNRVKKIAFRTPSEVVMFFDMAYFLRSSYSSDASRTAMLGTIIVIHNIHLYLFYLATTHTVKGGEKIDQGEHTRQEGSEDSGSLLGEGIRCKSRSAQLREAKAD